MPERLMGPLGVALAAVVAFVAALALAGGSSSGGKPDPAKASPGPTAQPVAFHVSATAPAISTGLHAATIPHLKPRPRSTSTGGGTTNPGGGATTGGGTTTGGGGTTGGVNTTGGTAPAITGASLSATRFRVASRRTAVSAVNNDVLTSRSNSPEANRSRNIIPCARKIPASATSNSNSMR